MSDLKKKRILVVDDDPRIAKLLKMVLSDYDVHAVTDGETALEEAKAAPPSLFIIDLILPGMRGTTLAVLLRDQPRFFETPIFLISGLIESPSDDREPVRVNGLTAFNKPFDIEKMRKHVRLHVEKPEEAAATLEKLRVGRITGE